MVSMQNHGLLVWYLLQSGVGCSYYLSKEGNKLHVHKLSETFMPGLNNYTYNNAKLVIGSLR